MAQTVLILGSSGTGKTTSVRNLPPEETAIISVIQKPLPFKGWKKNYTRLSKENPQGNLFNSDRHDRIIKGIDNFANNGKKYIVIDDFQYIMCNEFMRRAGEKGYEKFSQIAQNAWNVLFHCQTLVNQDIYIFVLSHTDTDEFGKTKAKTIGKMIDDKVCIEGMFTIVLQTQANDGQYGFMTQTNGSNSCKSPDGMFSEFVIPNDLKYVAVKMKEYEGDE